MTGARGSLVVARYGEVHLKGKNRGLFLRQLTQNLRAAAPGCNVELKNDRYVVVSPADYTIYSVANVFGITSASKVMEVKHDEILGELAKLDFSGKTFRVNVNRADKKFPHTSMTFSAMCGEVILKNNAVADGRVAARVDLHNPQMTINIDIREGDVAYLYTDTVAGVGGLPVGVSGKALVLISGGIDSPVAAWLAAKRGMRVELLHFASPPYTNAAALDKVKRLRDKLVPYCGAVPLHVVNLTPVLAEIKSKCNEAYMITLMRRFMVRIARKMCLDRHIDCIVTGENLAQVASQTIEGITTNNVLACEVPILRPLITYDKSEIITVAKRIGTYDVSIEPHADCCTVFVPESPIIAPTIRACEREEGHLDVDGLILGLDISHF